MGFYDEHLPVKNKRVANMKKIRNISLIGMPLIFGFIVYSENIKFDFSRLFVHSNNIIIGAFFFMFVYNVIYFNWIIKKIGKEEYLKKYGTKTKGIITSLKSFPTRALEIEFNGQKHIEKLVSTDKTKYTIGQEHMISYNPENPDEFVIIDGIDKYMQTLSQIEKP